MVVFQILARTEQSRTLPFVKKCDLEREEKDTIIEHNDAPVHGLASFLSLSLSLSFSLFLFARWCSMRLRPSKRARARVFYSREKVERFESSFVSSFFFLKKKRVKQTTPEKLKRGNPQKPKKIMTNPPPKISTFPIASSTTTTTTTTSS